MEDSIWTTTLAAFREKVGGTEPVPAGVTISAVSATIALALLAKVLTIASKKKDVSALLDAARAESKRLQNLADDDIQAFNQYMDCRRQGKDLTAAVRKAIEVPLDAARSAVRGLDLCAQTVGMIRGLTAADVGAAAALLSGAVQAMLLSVDFNIREMSSDEQFSSAIAAECRELGLEAVRLADAVTSRLGALLK
jgi:methenyltetrahydrofolate cyclohydrolase